jgi:hypothetical protein
LWHAARVHEGIGHVAAPPSFSGRALNYSRTGSSSAAVREKKHGRGRGLGIPKRCIKSSVTANHIKIVEHVMARGPLHERLVFG